MGRLMIIAASVSLLGCARCGSEAHGVDADGRGAESDSQEVEEPRGKPPVTSAEGIATSANETTDGGAIDVAPGPDDCWASGDVVELQIAARGFPVRGLKFEGPDCDDELEAAVKRGDFSAVRTMIEQVRIPDHWPARSPRCRTADMGNLLHLSAASGALHTTEYLISKGVNVRGCDREGATPLHVAAANLDLPMVKLLVDKGALLDAVDIEGNRPLHRCFDNRFLGRARSEIDPAKLAAAEQVASFLVGAGAKNIQNWIPGR